MGTVTPVECRRLGVHLVAGPNVFICEHCIDQAGCLASGNASSATTASLSVVDQDQTVTSSFCGKRQAEVDRLIAGPSARICTECVSLCREIQKEERARLRLDRP